LEYDSVAVLQSRVSGRDGRSRVAAELIETLNEMGVVPSLYTHSSKELIDEFCQGFGKQLHVKPFTIAEFNPLHVLTLSAALANFPLKKHISGYHTVWNMNNNPYFLPKGPRYIHYVHFPVDAAIDYHEKFDSGIHLWFRRAMKLYYRLARALSYSFLSDDHKLLANSQFTAENIRSCWRAPVDDIQVVYPPCDYEAVSQFCPNRSCISIGAFSEDKRQLEQIKIGSQLPHITFHLVGRSDHSPVYFQKCVAEKAKLKADNVLLHTDLDRNGLRDLLKSCSMGIHTKQFEHFGIAVVEILGSGCIPFVHDSGGPAEIVTDQCCRFRNIEEAVEKISAIDWDNAEQLYQDLSKNLHRYSAATFRQSIKSLLNKP